MAKWYNPFSWGRSAPPARSTRVNIDSISRRVASSVRTRIEKEMQDIRLATQSTETLNQKTSVVARGLRELRRQQPGVLNLVSYRSARGLYEDADFIGPQYNLVEVGKALDTESYFARAVQRHRELILKNGYRIVGRDPERVAYVKRRLWEIAMTTETTMDELFRELITNLVAYSNAMLIRKRDPSRSSGGRYKWKGRIYDPLSGLYMADPTTMSVKQTSTGLPTMWRQRPHNATVYGQARRTASGTEKKFPAHDVLHLTLDKRSGWIFGTPYIVPVLDDIRLLRRMEELVDIIAHKHAFPLFVATVGSEDQPATDVERDGVVYSEVDLFKDEIEEMEFEGGLVVTERHKIDMIGAEGKALDLGPYLEHIEMRVLGGLRLSEIDLGRGGTANRNTAQTITQTLIDACTEIQRVVEDALTWKLFFYILMEGGFNVRGDRLEDDMVYLDFPPIDTEERRAQENHEMALYQGSLINEDEARRRVGMDPIEDAQRDKMFLETHEIPLIEAKADAEVRVAKAKAGVSGGSSGSGSQASKNATENRNRPRNQHGTSPAKPRISMDEAEKLSNEFTNRILAMWGNHSDWVSDMRDPALIRMATSQGLTTMVDEAAHKLRPILQIGFRRGGGQADAKMPTSVLTDFVTKYLKKELKASWKRGMAMLDMDSWEDSRPARLQIQARLDSHSNWMALVGAKLGRYAYAYGFLRGAQDSGKPGVTVQNGVAKTFTFPVEPWDLVPTALDDFPELQVLED